jgi:anti-sigma factor RsiW
MTAKPTTVTDAELHAYVDGQLAATRVAEVEAWLAEHPDAAARAQAYRTQNAALQALFDPVLDEPLPARLTAPLSRSPLHRGVRAIAATAAWLTIGGLLGYALHGWQNPPVEMAQMAERAAVAHVVYAAEVLHPVEVTIEQESHLVQWLSKRLGRELHTPDFSGFGYQLIGGRLLPGDKGPAAQFMYQNPHGARLTLYVSVPGKDTPPSAFRYEEEDGTHVLYWVDRDLGFALAGEPERARLLDLAHVAYQAFNF